MKFVVSMSGFPGYTVCLSIRQARPKTTSTASKASRAAADAPEPRRDDNTKAMLVPHDRDKPVGLDAEEFLKVCCFCSELIGCNFIHFVCRKIRCRNLMVLV